MIFHIQAHFVTRWKYFVLKVHLFHSPFWVIKYVLGKKKHQAILIWKQLLIHNFIIGDQLCVHIYGLGYTNGVYVNI